MIFDNTSISVNNVLFLCLIMVSFLLCIPVPYPPDVYDSNTDSGGEPRPPTTIEKTGLLHCPVCLKRSVSLFKWVQLSTKTKKTKKIKPLSHVLHVLDGRSVSSSGFSSGSVLNKNQTTKKKKKLCSR